MAASIVAEPAGTVLAQHERLKRLDQQIQDALTQHAQARVIESIPGFGPALGASPRCGLFPSFHSGFRGPTA